MDRRRYEFVAIYCNTLLSFIYTYLYFGGTKVDSQLYSLFRDYDPAACLVMRKMSGMSRGFGIVKFLDGHRALESIRDLNGTTMGGRVLKVIKHILFVYRSFTNLPYANCYCYFT